MRIDIPSVKTDIGLAAEYEISAGASLEDIAEGESFTARVIFTSDNTVHLKTAEGAFIRARLEGGLTLTEGSEIELMAVEKGDGLLKLRLSEAMLGGGQPPGDTSHNGLRPALPPALAALLEQLQISALTLPQKLTAFMRGLSDFPGLNSEDAAVRQATALLTATGKNDLSISEPQPGDKAPPGPAALAPPTVGQMLQELTALLNQPQTDIPPSAARGPASSASVATALTPAYIKADTLAPLFALFMPQATDPKALPPAAAAESDPPPLPTAAAQSSLSPLPAAAAESDPPLIAQKTAVLEQTEIDAKTPQLSPQKTTTAQVGAPSQRELGLVGQQQTVISALEPATRQELLEFAQSLVNEIFPSGTEELTLKNLAAFAERLFVKIGEQHKNGGPALRRAARELEARLELLKEVLELSTLPQKEELLPQVGRALQLIAALREERLLCLQLPLLLGERQQTAELYVYNREKGGRKLDPNHATVLLALNTEHLGRLEAFVQVRQKDISLKLEIGRAEAVNSVREQSGALAKLLASVGYRLTFTTIQHLIRQTGPKTAGDALKEFESSFGHQVDIKI